MKLKWIFVATLVGLSTYANAGDPITSGDVVGRDLAQKGLTWAGHVGVKTGHGSDITQVMNEISVVQFVKIDNFKSKSAYWGAKATGTFVENPSLFLKLDTLAHNQMGNVDYTLAFISQPSEVVKTCISSGTIFDPAFCKGGQYKSVLQRGKFRCDTFVQWLYTASHHPAISGVIPRTLYDNLPVTR